MSEGNRIKQYSDNGYYHIYNRGVEKRLIFQDKQDYAVFLSYLAEYLLPKNEQELREKLIDPNTSYKEKDKIIKKLRLNNFCGEITLLAYCLMPNHFHIELYQKSPQSIDKFMNSLGTRYAMYFNKKYQRVGCLFQDAYKAVQVETDEQLLHLTRYIHKQALALQWVPWEPKRAQPCSYWEYVGKRKTKWVHPEEILRFFSKKNPKLSYQNFVKQREDFGIIGKFTLEK